MENIDDLFNDIDTTEGAGDGSGAGGDGTEGNPSEGEPGDGSGDGSGDGGNAGGDGGDGGAGDGAGGDGSSGGDGGSGSGGDGGDGSGDGNGSGDGGDGDIEHLSGIERYLSQFDIEGGIIHFEDGTEQHFTELEPDKQAEILQQLHDTAAKTVEEKYGLDETEIGLINYLRQSGKGIEEIVEEEVNNRLNTILASQQVLNTNIDELDNDLIYKAFLLKSNPEATAEQVDEDLEKAKAMSNYEKIVENLRNDLKREQEFEMQKTQETQRQELIKEIEEQRAEVVDAVKGLETVDGFKINDDLKNMVLDTILTVDDDGDSKFMVEVFGNPERLFKAAFWYLNGPDIVRSREEYWKKQKSEAFKRGQEAAKSGKISFSKEKPHQNQDTGVYNPDSFDDLY